MPNVLIDRDKLDVLANAISAKSGEALTLTLDEMVDAVDGIETGGGITPTGNIDITSAGTTDVTNYATATVASAEYLTGVDFEFYTENNAHKWRFRGKTKLDTSEGDIEGWIGNGTQYGEYVVRNAIAWGTSVTPTESSQTIGGVNYIMEGAVTVNAIPSNYVGSGITRGSSADLTANGATVTAPAGYYENNATKTIASGSAMPPSTITATSATLSTSSNTLTLTKSVSTTPVVTAGYVASGTAGTVSVSLSAPVTMQAAQTIYPSTSDQTIASGRYLTGIQTIKAVSQTNLSAENIKDGTTISISNGNGNIWSVTGTYTGGGGGTTKNVQITQATTRTSSSTLTAIGGEITCSKAGTYDVYWTGTRSTTSTSYTYGTQLYIGGTAYGTQNTAWNNHVQINHLTNVSLTANQKVRVYGRNSRGSSYYIYAPMLAIVEN